MGRPKIGLALGSGGSRGFSHLGVLNVLQKHDIPIDYIAGSSMGALVGALYGAGQRLEDLYTLASTFKLKYFMDFMVPKKGLIQGERIKSYIHMFTYGKNLEDFHIPVGIVATDIYNGEKVIFKTGDAANAVRASISIPGVFVPEEIDGRMLVDGGVIDRVPISVAREMGADLVIAVDCSKFESNSDVQTIYDVIMQSIDIMQADITQQMIMEAEVIMRPHVYQYSSRNYTQVDEIIREGEIEAEKYVAPIQKMIKDWKE